MAHAPLIPLYVQMIRKNSKKAISLKQIPGKHLQPILCVVTFSQKPITILAGPVVNMFKSIIKFTLNLLLVSTLLLASYVFLLPILSGDLLF